jgi:hypothetical protein
LLDRGVRTSPAVEHELFQLLRSIWFAIVLKEGESAALSRSEVRNRTVPTTTVPLKMIIGLRGIVTVEL